MIRHERISHKIRRKLRNLAFQALPKHFAHPLVRSSLNLHVPRKESRLSFEIVSNLSDLRAALTLVQKNFEREGYATPTRSGLRLTPYHLEPETLVIVAKDNDRIVATTSIIPRGPARVPLEACFKLDSLFAKYGKAVEISALAVDANYSGQFGQVLYNLMKFVYHCNIELIGAELEVIGVNPKMVPLYEAILLFQRIPKTAKANYEFVNGAPVIPMYFELVNAMAHFSKIYDGKPAAQNLKDFFLLPIPPQFKLPKREELALHLPQRRAACLREMQSWEPGVALS